jgi:6-phosphogluconolactonase
MTTKVVPGQLVAAQDAGQAAAEAAARIARALRAAVAKKGRAAVALSGGNTPRDAYGRLAREAGLEWSKIHVFFVDERAVPPADDRSNYRWAKATLLDPAAIPPANVHRMPADEPDQEAAAAAYEKTVRANVELDGEGVPAFDVVVLGVGEDGHTASLFPGEPTVEILDRLVAAVPASTGQESTRHEARLTLTTPSIEHARTIFVLAVGANKRPALERAWSARGKLGETPARVVRGCRGAVTWIIDKAAGGLEG